MAIVALDPEAIEQPSDEHEALLDTIDSLRKHGIGRFADLPEIIVVGDESSGKSSVLEAILRVRFPDGDGLSTRFATELVLRPSPQTRVSVRVQPASVLPDVDCNFNETTFDKKDIPRIIKEAKACLLRDKVTFSEDILHVEICSPEVPRLTLVDLPGFDHAEEDNQSSDGRETVDRLVEAYMGGKNTIILAIVSVRKQSAMERVLSKVKEHDKSLERTLGILTKPNLLTAATTYEEERYIRLAKNKDKAHQLGLGWHVLRIRSDIEDCLSPEELDSKENAFFESGSWSGIPSNDRGISTLRKKIANILLDNIRKNLNTLIEDIQNNMDNRKEFLKSLGTPRSSPTERRVYLNGIASYSNLSMSESRVRKLRALVRDLNRTFAYVLATKGSGRIIVPDEADEDSDHNKNEYIRNNKDKSSEEIGLPSYLHSLEAYYQFNKPIKVTRSVIRNELDRLSSANRGTEFPGTTNDLFTLKLFREQSSPWEEIARFHIDFVLRNVKYFTEKLVAYIIGPDEKTRSAILVNMVDPFFEERTSKLDIQLQELLRHYQTGYPQLSEAEFRAVLSDCHKKQQTTEVLQSLLSAYPELLTEEGKRHLAGLISARPKTEFNVDSLIDKSEIYYELSLRNFTENVIILAIENCLIIDLPTILTTSAVSQMDDTMLERLAVESSGIQVQRSKLRLECETLQNGLDRCKAYKTRKSPINNSQGSVTPKSPSSGVAAKGSKAHNSNITSDTNQSHGSSSSALTPSASGPSNGSFTTTFGLFADQSTASPFSTLVNPSSITTSQNPPYKFNPWDTGTSPSPVPVATKATTGINIFGASTSTSSVLSGFKPSKKPTSTVVTFGNPTSIVPP
ncbi:P-loop containing nucleoside triphosphate hydrolase protein [Xylaria palmicola]|nr:P-loop containing nucleoside triphosphate hydrolase protein [Xylaria palmicola]